MPDFPNRKEEVEEVVRNGNGINVGASGGKSLPLQGLAS
jgi:hypothetical protein